MNTSPPPGNNNFDSFLLPSKTLHHRLRLLSSDGHPIDSSEIPPEQEFNLVVGLSIHFLPLLVFCIACGFLEDKSLTSITTAFLISSAPAAFVLLYVEQKYPAKPGLPPCTIADVIAGLWQGFGIGWFAGSTIIYLGFQALQHLMPWEGSFSYGKIAWACLLDDFIYYCYHRWFSHSVITDSELFNYFRGVHIPHHSVSELDFLRGNLSSFLDTSSR